MYHSHTSILATARSSTPHVLSPRHFINLTNGLEALSALHELIPSAQLRFTRIQSSHCESGAYDKLLCGLDNELLFSLACGRQCYVYDFASRNKTCGVSRAIFLGVQFIKWSLAYLWFHVEAPERVPQRVMVRGKNVVPFWRDEVMAYRISRDAKKRVRYYASFAKELGVNEVKLTGIYGRLSRIDGCRKAHVELARQWIEQDKMEEEDAEIEQKRFMRWAKEHYLSAFEADSTSEQLIRIQKWMTSERDGRAE